MPSRQLMGPNLREMGTVRKQECQPLVGIGTGNPGVFQGYPYPYRRKPVPAPRGTGTGTGSAKTRGYATRMRVHSQSRLRNLAIAVQVSIDTAVQHCEVRNRRGVIHPFVGSLLLVGWLVGARAGVCVRVRAG